MIAWALTYLLHSTLLVAAAAALVHLPRGRAPRTRDAIWKCALVGGLLTATLQQAIGGAASLAIPMLTQDLRGAMDVASTPAEDPFTVNVFRIFRGHVPWVALVWGVTSGLAALRLGRGWIGVRRAAGRRRVLSAGPLRRELDTILREAGIRRRVTLSCSRGLTVPRAIGFSEICVPVRVLRDLSAAEQRALLAHETAHLLRHDGAWLFAAAVLQIVAWWQPLTRVAAARLRHSMELCCDDWAASRLPDRLALAECLVKVGEWGAFVPRGVRLAAFAVHGSALRERVERLIDTDCAETPSARGLWLAALLLLAVLALAPRVTLAVAGPASPAASKAAAAAADVLPSTAIAAAIERRPPGPVRRRATRAPSPKGQAPLASAGTNGASRLDEPVQAMPSSQATSIIEMPEPLLRPSPASLSTGLTRAATAAARSVSPRNAPEPLVGKDELLRRVGMWLEFQRRTPSFDPLHPKY